MIVFLAGSILVAAKEHVTTGTIGFIVIALLGLALFFLIRSMNKQIRRINVSDDTKQDASRDSDGGTSQDDGGTEARREEKGTSDR